MIRGALLLVAAVSLWIAFHRETALVLEDALITFRHAENLATGQGYGFNPGEWVQGSTTPLLTLLLAGSATFFGAAAIPTTAVVIGMLAGCITILLSLDLMRHWECSPTVQVLAMMAWIATPSVAWSTVGGMETPLVACGMALSLWAAERGYGRWFGAAIASILLTRPDTLIWVLALIPFTLTKRDLWVRAWPFALPVIAWLCWATWAFGTPVPHSVLAKTTVNPAHGNLLDSTVLLNRLDWLSEAYGATWPAGPPVGWGLLALGSCMVLSRLSRLWSAALLYILLFALASHYGRSPRFFWYPVPSVWAVSLVGAAGLQRLVDWLPWLAKSRIAWLMLIGLNIGAVERLQNSAEWWRQSQENEDQMRAQAGHWIAQNTPTDAVVAMEAIGYQGTRSQRRIVDFAGLISPSVLQIAKEEPKNAKRFARILNEIQPEVIVLRSFEIPKNRHFHGGKLFLSKREKKKFSNRYREAVRFTAPHPKLMRRNHTVVIYVDRQMALSPEAPSQ